MKQLLRAFLLVVASLSGAVAPAAGADGFQSQTVKLARLRGERSNEAVRRSLDALRRAAQDPPRAGGGGRASGNTMPYLLDCARAYATGGEICSARRSVWGVYEETPTS